MRDAIHASLKPILDTLQDEHLVTIIVPAPLMRLSTFAASPIVGNRLLWIPPHSHSKQWGFAGIGEAVTINASQNHRFYTVKTKAQVTLDNVIEINSQTTAVSKLRFWGGAAFFENSPQQHGWQAFPNTSFFIPKWLYAQNGSQSFVRLTLTAQQITTPHLLDKELTQLENYFNDVVQVPSSPFGHLPKVKHEIHTNIAQWSSLIKDTLNAINRGSLQKVVISRCSELQFHQNINISNAFHVLETGYEKCFRFAFQKGDSVFLGATPERLVKTSDNGLTIESDALAGSINRTPTDTEHTLQKNLLTNDKDQREFDFVLQDLITRIKTLGAQKVITTQTGVKTFRDICHIHAKITGHFLEPIHILAAVKALHPTPAVCGTPQEPAAEWIQKNETHQRGWYAGPVGWFDQTGQGDFAVALRCGLIHRNTAKLYAGCGIVPGSDAQLEYKETATKQKALRALLTGH